MQAIKNITQTQTTTVESVHADTVYAVLQNAFNNLTVMEADCTGASYFINSANIYAQLADLYASFAQTNDYVALDSVMQVFANNITYYDESSLYDDCVKNTAMQNVNLLDFAYLSN